MGKEEGTRHYLNRYTNEHEEFKKYFAAVMGCGQGDNPSSLNWKAFIDSPQNRNKTFLYKRHIWQVMEN